MRDFEDILDSLDLEVDESSIIPPLNTQSISNCVFCSGQIIEENLIDNETSYHCSSCGLKYKFLPKQKVITIPPQPRLPNIK